MKNDWPEEDGEDWFLLIAPEGIEKNSPLAEANEDTTLLIAPEGIEKIHDTLLHSKQRLLIAPEGIENI